MHRRLSAVFAFAVLLAAGSAHADDAREQSRAAFRKGVALAKDNNYVAARDAFAEAYRLFPHPSILLNLGIARARTNDLVDAEQDLVKFLADDGGATADEIKSARQALSDCREKLGTVNLTVKPATAKVTMDGKPVALLSGGVTPLRAAGGRHALKVAADGYVPVDRNVEVLSKIEVAETIELAPNAPKATEEPPPGPEKFPTRIQIGVTLLGVGAVTGAIAAVFGLRGLSMARDYNDQETRPRDTTLRDKAQTTLIIADVGGVVALAAAGFGAYFVLVKPQRSNSASAGFLVGPSFSGAKGNF